MLRTVFDTVIDDGVTAEFDGQVLTSFHRYAGPPPHEESFRYEPAPPADADYWCAFGGQCHAFKAVNKNTCIASLQHDLKAQTHVPTNRGWDSVYVIHRPQSCSQSVWLRWCKKWAYRTAVI